MFEGEMMESIEESLEKIKLVYANATEERKRYIKDWIDGIVIDKDKKEGYLDTEFDGENITMIDEETGNEIELEDLSETELWELASYLEDLLDELQKM